MQELNFWDSNSLQGLTYTGFSSLNILFKTAPVSCYLKANVSLDKFTWTKETISKPTSSGNVSWKAFFILISTSVSLNSFQNSKALIMWPFSCKHNLLTWRGISWSFGPAGKIHLLRTDLNPNWPSFFFLFPLVVSLCLYWLFVCWFEKLFLIVYNGGWCWGKAEVVLADAGRNLVCTVWAVEEDVLMNFNIC